jgi:anaphase-promoting complex subunit 1
VALARTAPCLLPEFDATEQLEVAGGRYWPQRWAAGGGASGALAKLFRQRSLFVKKKAGALAYADDPSGIRSLLSRVFVRAAARAGAGAWAWVVGVCGAQAVACIGGQQWDFLA